MRRIGFESYLHCYCLDPRCYEELSKEHDLVHMVKDNSEVIHDLQDFRVGQWAHVTFNKFRIISENLNKYDYVVFTDGDIVFENMEFIRYLESNIGDNDIL